ncbi:MAG: glycoside hydrolase family 71/99-like protein [Verrucomicrobiota bacterium]|nr:glycoside hydrolase family 71/99-like protein [Limisphaera sp.]MDW8381236.1 glycoside hydrolase family 71/99-like protein [Verrucomicrobiota bacterium]
MRNRIQPTLLWATLWLMLDWSAPGAPGVKPILVYYLAWYAAPPHSPEWGWHWTMNRFQPDRTNALGEREIASWYQPQIGPYDSSDPAVLEYHTLLLRLAGADGVVVGWFGPEKVHDYAQIDQRLQKLIPFLERAGLKLALCYEDRSLQEFQDARPAESSAAERAVQALQYAERQYFGLPLYFRWQERPVLLNFGPQVLRNPGDWPRVLEALSSRPALLTIDTPVPGAVGAFAWPPMWLSQAPGAGGVLSGTALQRYLTQFEKAAMTWPVSISTAFPRFHDIHPRAGARAYWGYLGDRGGVTFRETLRRALTNATSMALIATWNDFGEGTQIEPTREFGSRDLEVLRELRRAHGDPTLPGTADAFELVLRLYQLRRAAHGDPAIGAALDEIAADLAGFRCERARSRLAALSSNEKPTTDSAGQNRTP